MPCDTLEGANPRKALRKKTFQATDLRPVKPGGPCGVKREPVDVQ